jgi:hypothetical protein
LKLKFPKTVKKNPRVVIIPIKALIKKPDSELSVLYIKKKPNKNKIIPKILTLFIICLFLLIFCNVYVYELWRGLARTSPNKNWLWEIRRIFQVRTDQAIAYIRLKLAF